MRLGFIGTGAMAGAIARGIRASGNKEAALYFFDVNQPLARSLALEVDGTPVLDVRELLGETDIIILAVKPHIQRAVLQELSLMLGTGTDPALLSIAAGRSLANMADDLREFGVENLPPLIRVMPNVNAQIGASMSAICFTPEVSPEAREAATQVFEAVGECLELPESLFGPFSALAGASPAWFFQILDSFARAGVKHGMTKEQALAAVTQSMLGSARMAQQAAKEGVNPSALIDRVCSPGGTTVAGLLAAQEAGLDTALVKAVDATVKRDQELGS